jgi:hypothetical protein
MTITSKRLETKIISLQNRVERLTQKKMTLTNKKVDFKVQYGGGTSKLPASQLQRKQNMKIQHTNVNTQLQQARVELREVRNMRKLTRGGYMHIDDFFYENSLKKCKDIGENGWVGCFKSFVRQDYEHETFESMTLEDLPQSKNEYEFIFKNIDTNSSFQNFKNSISTYKKKQGDEKFYYEKFYKFLKRCNKTIESKETNRWSMSGFKIRNPFEDFKTFIGKNYLRIDEINKMMIKYIFKVPWYSRFQSFVTQNLDMKITDLPKNQKEYTSVITSVLKNSKSEAKFSKFLLTVFEKNEAKIKGVDVINDFKEFIDNIPIGYTIERINERLITNIFTIHYITNCLISPNKTGGYTVIDAEKCIKPINTKVNQVLDCFDKETKLAVDDKMTLLGY